MTFSSCLTDQHEAIVLDASVLINLLATGNAGSILVALDAPLLVTEHVVREIGRGISDGRSESGMLAPLIEDQVLKVEELTGPSLDHFFEMVSGQTSNTLGDGEAATLAFAHSNGFSAAIDERKATRIAAERFGKLKLITSVDILAYAPVQASLGRERLASMTLQALRLARMQVWDHQFDWVVQLIGQENLGECPSLKKLSRRRSAALSNYQA